MNKVQLKNVIKAYDNNEPVIEDLDLSIKEGSFTVLLGPSGCGKSTILRMIAGLEKVTDGEIFIDNNSMNKVEPGDRNIAMVFQNYALYPTMTVKGNIEFGLKNMKVPKPEREKRINDISNIVGLDEYLRRKPQTLSGGQRQRVALARAIVKDPSVFLMDEPLSNLDAKLRNQIRTELIELHRKLKTTFIYVTHDQVEAMSMGTEIVLLDKGKIMQQADPYEIYHNPQNVFTAKFIGSPAMNIIEAADENWLNNDKVKYIGFRPENVSISSLGESVDDNNISLAGELITHEMLGAEILYKIKTKQGMIQAKIYNGNVIPYGDVQIVVPKQKLYYFDENEQRLLLNVKEQSV